ncbi:MAG: hypothetical protein LBB88_01610 [Planctomycetaceae bacterium]|jgi:hypothetical protein|nr:hypothetical protein [Planctomycetaceae bacterium]
MKCQILLSALAIAVVFAVSSTAEAGMFGRLSHIRSCTPCGEIQVCEPCHEVVAKPCEPVCEPICEPCQPCGDCAHVRPFRPISRFVSAIRERIALRRHNWHDCNPCAEVACEPCGEIAVVASPCNEVVCDPCEPSCDDLCARPGFFARLKSRLAALRPIHHGGCEPCQPACEPCQPVCEPCQPATPCIPCVPHK